MSKYIPDTPLFTLTGEPILNDAGEQITWVDMVARVAQLAREQGKQLVIWEDEHGEVLYAVRYTDENGRGDE